MTTLFGRAQSALDEGINALLHENTIFKGSRTVTLVGEKKQFIVLLRANQRVDQPRRVSKMHILVDESVHQQQRTFNLIHMGPD
mmetsp:Transcript_27043/g.22703  ORF Transcript_27043/g.22703 Transcript_27043/m.22703 type:complete len:84 (+) Transcript_27043:22-273(+)